MKRILLVGGVVVAGVAVRFVTRDSRYALLILNDLKSAQYQLTDEITDLRLRRDHERNRLRRGLLGLHISRLDRELREVEDQIIRMAGHWSSKTTVR